MYQLKVYLYTKYHSPHYFDPKSFHSYVRSSTKTKNSVRDDEGDVITDNSIADEVLNEYFASHSVFMKETLANMPDPVQEFKGEAEEKLVSTKFTLDEVFKTIHKMKPNNARGPDSIDSCILRETADCLAKPLARIFQCSLQDNYVPPDWKAADVTPIYKKGHKTVSANYSPVSLTSQLCKLMDSMIRDAIVEHLRHHKLLTTSQHGLLKPFSIYILQSTRAVYGLF